MSPAPGLRLRPVAGQGVRLEGSLRASDAVALHDALPVDGQPLQVDLGGIEAVDSAGLALLLDWQARRRQQGGELTLISAPEALVRLARISGVDTLLAMPTNDAEMTGQ